MSIEFDTGPLTWVKGEIDQALQQADEKLAQFAADASDSTPLRQCQTHLHQVSGAIQMVGLEGVARLGEAIEQLVGAMEKREVAISGANLDLIKRGMAALSQYLEDLLGGQPDQPLRLFPVYHALLAARGVEKVSESELFFPDLTLRAPKNPDVHPRAAEALPSFLKAERARYERGLLGFLRNAEDSAALGKMRDALAAIEQTQTVPALRTFWWSATGLAESLLHKGLDASLNLKQLCGRIDQQIRRLAEGSPKVAERLLRDVLYFVARSKPVSGRVAEIQGLFELEAYMPHSAEQEAAKTEQERMLPLLRELRDLLASAKEAWLKFTSGSNDSLANFHAQARRLADRASALENAPLNQLLHQIGYGAAALAAHPADMNEMVAMEMATALLLAENTLEHYLGATDEFTRQAEVQSSRLQAALQGRLDEIEVSDIPLLDEMSRKAQEKLLLAQVGQEIQSNLQHIEQVLDGFFRDTAKRDELPGLKPFLKQIQGALKILELEPAIKLLDECERLIDGFSQPGHEPRQAQMEQVAEGLSSLGFYVEAIQRGRADAVQIVDGALARLNPAAQAPLVATPVEIPEEQAATSVEASLEDQKQRAQALLEQWQENPDDAQAKADLKKQFSVLQQDAELVADGTLKSQATEAMRLLEQAEMPTAELATATAALSAPKMAASVPSAETTRLAGEADETIDAEMLEIFLEEADEVLATVTGNLDLCHARPNDREALATLRRSFHTLKGSGRMVGLWELGEVAWAIEQVMNKWLQEEKNATPELLALLGQAHQRFLGWVAALKASGTVRIMADDLVAEAERLKTGMNAPGVAVPPEAPAAAAEETPAAEPGMEISAPPGEEPAEEIISIVGLPAEETPSVAETCEESAEAEPLPAALMEQSAPASEAGVEAEPPAGVEAQQPPVEEEREISVGSVTLPYALYSIFINEAGQHLATLRQHLDALTQNPEVAVQHDFMRAAHTLCGISRTVGFPAIAELGFPLEMWLQELLQHPVPLTAKQVDLMGEAIAALGKMVEAIRDGQEPKSAQKLVRSLEGMLNQARVAREPLAVAPAPAAITEEAAVAAPPAVQESVHPIAAPPSEAPRERRVIRDDIDPDLLPIFLEEAQDLFPLVGGQLRAWRANTADRPASDGLQRTLHTLKGSARMAGAMRLGELTHNMEARVLAALDSEDLPPALFDTLESEFDRMGDVLEQLRSGPLPEAEAVPASAAVMAPAEPAAVAAAPVAEPEAAARVMLRMRADVVDRLVNEAGEVSIARSRIEGEMQNFKRSLLDLTESVNRLRNQLREIEIQAESQMQSRQSLARESHEAFDPLEFDRFTRLQEVTRMMAESVNDVASVQHNLLKNLDETEAALLAQSRMTKELQQELLHARMVPLASISERLFRIARQTSKELDKRATLEIIGEQVELDRSVLEKMTAPFEHLLRNAIDHGLESREARLAAGKEEVGVIELQARQEGNEILLTLRDDGRGLDLDGIRRKAIELGMLAPEDEVAPAQLMELIFFSGFSTAAEVTQVSGRGIGMDVVRNEIASLGGRIEVASEAGKGTTFSIYLPLTLAVAQAVLVRAGSQVYALPSTMVDQVQELKADALAEIYQKQQVTWQGNAYPLHYFPRLLGDQESTPAAQRYTTVMLLHSGAQHVAVHVDELIGNREIVVKNIGPQLARVPGVAGATVLGNGKVVLILNPVQLAQRQGIPALLGHRPAAEVAQQPAATPLVMIVDDSLTVRKITSKLLTREGYQVVTAKDGVDALQALEDVTPQVMLVDIEMPRMDGFELTKNVRGNERTAHIPIIMITSRTADKHRNYAQELGVNVYLGKPYQEEELLGYIAGFVRGNLH
jgi:chemosensory pili system protein ChpA (sensor histidine kinase/response regulator)